MTTKPPSDSAATPWPVRRRTDRDRSSRRTEARPALVERQQPPIAVRSAPVRRIRPRRRARGPATARDRRRSRTSVSRPQWSGTSSSCSGRDHRHLEQLALFGLGRATPSRRCATSAAADMTVAGDRGEQSAVVARRPRVTTCRTCRGHRSTASAPVAGSSAHHCADPDDGDNSAAGGRFTRDGGGQVDGPTASRPSRGRGRARVPVAVVTTTTSPATSRAVGPVVGLAVNGGGHRPRDRARCRGAARRRRASPRRRRGRRRDAARSPALPPPPWSTRSFRRVRDGDDLGLAGGHDDAAFVDGRESDELDRQRDAPSLGHFRGRHGRRHSLRYVDDDWWRRGVDERDADARSGRRGSKPAR